MTQLYSEQDVQAIQQQLKKRYLVLIILSVIFTAAITYSFVIRLEWLTMVTVVLLGLLVIFILDFLCRPLWCYRRHLNHALHGRTHEMTVAFSQADEEQSVVDGVTYRNLIFLGEPDRHGVQDLLFYWDVLRPMPAWKQGQSVTLKFYDKNIIGYKNA